MQELLATRRKHEVEEYIRLSHSVCPGDWSSVGDWKFLNLSFGVISLFTGTDELLQKTMWK